MHSRPSFNQAPQVSPTKAVRKNITICVGDKCGPDVLEKISKVICNTDKGECKIFISSNENGERLETPHHIGFDETVINSIRNIVGKENVEIE